MNVPHCKNIFGHKILHTCIPEIVYPPSAYFFVYLTPIAAITVAFPETLLTHNNPNLIASSPAAINI